MDCGEAGWGVQDTNNSVQELSKVNGSGMEDGRRQGRERDGAHPRHQNSQATLTRQRDSDVKQPRGSSKAVRDPGYPRFFGGEEKHCREQWGIEKTLFTRRQARHCSRSAHGKAWKSD